jgi:polyribonucleotide nucleotidyltransferase
MSKKIEKSINLGGRKLTLSTGDIAQQANGAVIASYGETVVLATVVAAPLDRDLDYFPLTVEYQERLYAGGRIKGSHWVKREGKPTDEEILTARLIDRSIRPLFPKSYKKDVQVICMVLSVDLENSPEITAAVATSAAIAISDIPWDGPIGVTNVGMTDSKYVTNPTESQSTDSKMDLVVSSTKDAIVMVEAGSDLVTEEQMAGGIEFGQKEGAKVIKLINDFVKVAGRKKEKVEEKKVKSEIAKKVKKDAEKQVSEMITKMAKKEASYSDMDELRDAVADQFEDEERADAVQAFEDLFKAKVRKMILSGKRPDGRKPDEIRALSAKVGVLPRTHGSGIFQRGQTQALTIATLGSSSYEQFLETAAGEETKRYIHHYSMPPYSTGETGRVGSPKRREIGHGALAERALMPVVPSEEEFPYTIRLVTEILSSNGSTSMAATCGSTLSLMDAGVPIKTPIGGIAMGLIIDSPKKYKVLTDIVGLEDGNGDMDFKVTGSRDGITALQLDVKTLKLTAAILKEALKQAKKARLEVLDVIEEAIAKPRKKVSQYAPKIQIIKIRQDKIGELIGPGGKTIKRLSEETETSIDVEDDGSVTISGPKLSDVEEAVKRVQNITKVPEPGEIYEGEVKRIQPFGAFVEILPGKDGLVHVSDMSRDFVKDPNDVVKIGDKMQVRVKEIDNMGRLNLSMILDPAYDKEKEERRKNSNDRRGSRDNRGRDRGRRSSSRGRGRDRGRSSGPHFPKSRLIDKRK